MKFITWNVAGRVGKLTHQIAFLKERNPDIVTLQEVTVRTLPMFKEQFPSIGLIHIVSSFDFYDKLDELKGPRRYGLLIASKFPLKDAGIGSEGIIWPERLLTSRVITPDKEIMIHTTHIPPGSSNGLIKVEMLEGIYRSIGLESGLPRILSGDFNLPQEETGSGQVYTWGQRKDRYGVYQLNGTRGVRWDQAERNIILRLGNLGLVDVFRQLYGYEKQDYSWVLKMKGKTWQRRYDHVFASNSLIPMEANYIHSVREQKLSDHSILEVLFD